MNARFRTLMAIATTLTITGMSVRITSTVATAIAIPISPDTPMLLATAYTVQTLPTLRRGNRGEAVRKLQQILQSNGFLEAANVRLGNPGRNMVDGIFGAATESAIRDLQRRYKLPVTGVVNPTTWEVLDTKENPYRALLPWKR